MLSSISILVDNSSSNNFGFSNIYFNNLIDFAKYRPSAILSSNVNDISTYFLVLTFPCLSSTFFSFITPIVDTTEFVP